MWAGQGWAGQRGGHPLHITLECRWQLFCAKRGPVATLLRPALVLPAYLPACLTISSPPAPHLRVGRRQHHNVVLWLHRLAVVEAGKGEGGIGPLVLQHG